jgi:hypothetical protein
MGLGLHLSFCSEVTEDKEVEIVLLVDVHGGATRTEEAIEEALTLG